MTDIVFNYKPRDWQAEVAAKMTRFTTLVVHRRAGKTIFSAAQALSCILSSKHPRPQVAHIGPNKEQVKRFVWNDYKALLDPLLKAGMCRFNESELRIDFSPIDRGTIYLLGAENPNSIRGMYFDFVILDEYQLHPFDFFDKVIRPAVADRCGPVLFAGTPDGKNHLYQNYLRGKDEEFKEWSSFLYTVHETGAIGKDEIASIKQGSTDEAFAQEYECSFEVAAKGAYFARNIEQARREGRIRPLLHDPSYPVVASWDIGFDGTVIWFCQNIGGELRIIDAELFTDRDIPYVVNKLLNKPYTYAHQIVPHDSAKRQIVDKRKTARGQIESLGLKCKVETRASIDDGIHAAKNLIGRCIFSDTLDKQVKYGTIRISPLEALCLYRAEYDDEMGVIASKALNDRYGHVADSFRTLAMGLKNSGSSVSKIEEQLGITNNKNTIDNNWRIY